MTSKAQLLYAEKKGCGGCDLWRVKDAQGPITPKFPIGVCRQSPLRLETAQNDWCACFQDSTCISETVNRPPRK